ncbi:hypothetical protein LGK95_11220 [Clostridium algoriphilum]|uniref:hypothetical protein n=1 Tax=Clostridium algoriphilum TaxID=198347 RepID=UPI001CF23BCF|nr:hypothetical protein [Clostridium algoriphilum]MCB2294090.1 hypothetical protein [Clostridium algoriphilum]
MGRSTLVKSADKIGRVSEDSIKEYVDKMEALAVGMNEIMLRREDILELIGGEKNITMMKENHNNHLRFVASILQTPDSGILVDTTLGVFRAYMSRGFSPDYWEVQLNTWRELLKQNMTDKAFLEVISIYNWFTVNIPHFTVVADEKSKHMDND